MRDSRLLASRRQVISDRRFPYSSLKLLGSARRAPEPVSMLLAAAARLAISRPAQLRGQQAAVRGRGVHHPGAKRGQARRPQPCCFARRLISFSSFAGVDLALFSAGGDVSRAFAPIASAAGATVVDNSSAFRQEEGVPLVIPEVNAAALSGMRAGKGGIVANPNCSTIIALMAVTPLHRLAGVRRMVVSTYQAASGAGAAAMAELETQTREVLDGRPVTKKIFKQQARPFGGWARASAAGLRSSRVARTSKHRNTMSGRLIALWGADGHRFISEPSLSLSACLLPPLLCSAVLCLLPMR
jgi:hypothetical protein